MHCTIGRPAAQPRNSDLARGLHLFNCGDVPRFENLERSHALPSSLQPGVVMNTLQPSRFDRIVSLAIVGAYLWCAAALVTVVLVLS